MGGYLRLALLPDERIVYQPTLAPQSLFALPGLTAGLALVCLLGSDLRVFTIPLLLIAAMFAVGKWIVYRSTELALTNRRFVQKSGWISRRSGEVMLSKIETTAVAQSMFGRIFDYGNVAVIGTGGTRELFKGIRDPFALHRAIQAQLDAMQTRTTGTP